MWTSLFIFLSAASGQQAPAGKAADAAAAGDWPTYMHDAARSGVSPVAVRLPLNLQWVYQARQAPQPAWPPPAKADVFHRIFTLEPRVTYDLAFHIVGAGGSVYFASSADDKVYCLDAATGREKWAFYTEGPVRLAPTIADGQVLFGSDDGLVYCLKAADGSLVWRVRLGEGRDRRIAGNGRVISAHPVRTGALVEDSRGYFCAGLFAAEGIYYGVLDITSGKKLAGRKLDQHVQGYLELRGDSLFAPTGRNRRGASLDQLAGRSQTAQVGKDKISSQHPYANIASPALRFCGGDGEVAAFKLGSAEKVWSAKVEGKAHSLTILSGKLLVSTDKGMIYCFAPQAAATRRIEPPAPKPIGYSSDAVRDQYVAVAAKILEQTDRRKGYCLVLNSEQGQLAYELAKRSEFKIVCLEADAAKVAASRKALDDAGLYGRVVVHQGSSDKLPYADYMFNLVVHDPMAAGKPFTGSREEADRVTSPCGGVAVFSLAKPDAVARGPLKGAGRWTHFYADAGNSACSGDTLIRGAMAVQWFGLPGPRSMVDRHNRGASPLYADGLLFVSGYDYVASVDAYNGTVLWERELLDSARPISLKNCGNMAAAEGALYVAAKDKCLAFDAASGKVGRTFSVPTAGCDWGYVACVDRTLFGSETKVGASRVALSPDSWTAGYSPNTPVVCSDSLFAYDRGTGRRLWAYVPKAGVIANPTIAVGGGRIYFIESTNPETRTVAAGKMAQPVLLGKGANLVALDTGTGKVVWSRPVQTALQHALYLSYAQGKLLLSGSRVAGRQVAYDVHAFDAATGKDAWTATYVPPGKVDRGGGHGELTQHPVIVDKTVYIWTSAYDLQTGRQIPNWTWNRGGHGCGTLSSSATALFYRGGNPQMTELATGRQTRLTQETRPGCWINVIPAGGLVLIPEGSSGCTCDYAIQTSIALAPVGK